MRPSKMSAARSALESVSQRAKFLLDEYDSQILTESETELIKMDEQPAIVGAKLSGDYVQDREGRPSLAGMLIKIKTWGS